jgi:hypothetical protein
MSDWWYCTSRDAYYNLSTISKIKFVEPGSGCYKIELFKDDPQNAEFIFKYDIDELELYDTEKNEIMELIGMND